MLPGETEPQGAADADTVPRPTMAKVWSRFVHAKEQDLPASGEPCIKVCGDRTANLHKV